MTIWKRLSVWDFAAKRAGQYQFGLAFDANVAYGGAGGSPAGVSAEGRDMDVTVKPAAQISVGTTPKFWIFIIHPPGANSCAPKTEFNHIDEIIRRIALARFDVTLNLSHNGKLVRRAVAKDGQKSSARTDLRDAAEQALAIEWQHGDLTLRAAGRRSESHHHGVNGDPVPVLCEWSHDARHC